MTDRELLDLLERDGEAGAAALQARYAALAASIARRVLPDRPEDVEEVAADTLIAVWQKRARLRPDTLRGFVIAASRNLAVDRWRQLGRRQEVPLLEGDGEDAACLDELLIGEELQKQILAVSPPDGEIFLRHYLLLESAEEIAARFSMTESAVRSRLYRTRMRLREEVQKHG